MLNHIIEKNKQFWLQAPNCPVKGLMSYIRQRGKMRQTQIEAIETYLYLKIAGQNKALWQLFAEGFFTPPDINLGKLNINEKARDYLSTHPEALALFHFARQKKRKRFFTTRIRTTNYQSAHRIGLSENYSIYFL